VADLVELRPLSGHSQAGDLYDYIIKRTAAAFGIPYTQLVEASDLYTECKFRVDFRPAIPPRLDPLKELRERLLAKTMTEYHRARERAAAIYLFGYDPQMLLEDQRSCKRPSTP
jgi:hypothetical protein